MATVGVICVNFHTEGHVGMLMQALAPLTERGFKLCGVVVDCSDTMSTLDPGYHLQIARPGKNLGFARAVNLAAEHVDVDVLLIVNPDLEPHVSGIAGVLAAVSSGRAVAASGVLRNSDGSVQRNAAPSSAIPRFAAEYLLGIDTRLPEPSADREVAVLAGSLLAVNSEEFQRVGGFDPMYPLYMEDVVLSDSLKRRGPLLQLAKECGVHSGGAASAFAPKSTWLLLHASRVRYFQRRSNGQGRLMRGIVITGVAVRAGLGRFPIRWLPALWRATARDADLAGLLPTNAPSGE